MGTPISSYEQEGELLRRAYAAWFRSGGSDQPGSSSSVDVADDKQYVVLRNARGTMAVYRVRTDGILKRMKRWPRDLDD